MSPQGTTIISSKIPLGTASNTALALAAKLSIELEDEEKQLKLFINEKRNLLQASRIQNEDMKIKQSENKQNNSSSMILEEEFNDYNNFEEFSSQQKHHLSSSNFIDDKTFTEIEENEKIKDDVITSSCDTKKGEEKVPQEMTYKGELTSG